MQTPPPAVAAPPPTLSSVDPPGTRAGLAFNKQPDGSSALAATGSGFAPGAAITANGQRLETVFGNEGWLTANVPASIYATAGRVPIVVVNPDGAASAPVDFIVRP
ncbi:MAG: hypothetical protein R2729_25540 [Bryobacteraceae bacterium]